jgi:hypothetical protein
LIPVKFVMDLQGSSGITDKYVSNRIHRDARHAVLSPDQG